MLGIWSYKDIVKFVYLGTVTAVGLAPLGNQSIYSFVQHFLAIGEFKLELQSGNAQSGSNSTIFRAVWPWNLMDNLEKQ